MPASCICNRLNTFRGNERSIAAMPEKPAQQRRIARRDAAQRIDRQQAHVRAIKPRPRRRQRLRLGMTCGGEDRRQKHRIGIAAHAIRAQRMGRRR